MTCRGGSVEFGTWAAWWRREVLHNSTPAAWGMRGLAVGVHALLEVVALSCTALGVSYCPVGHDEGICEGLLYLFKSLSGHSHFKPPPSPLMTPPQTC